MLPVSLDCPFLIALSVFSNVYCTYHANILYVNNGLFLIVVTIIYSLLFFAMLLPTKEDAIDNSVWVQTFNISFFVAHPELDQSAIIKI